MLVAQVFGLDKRNAFEFKEDGGSLAFLRVLRESFATFAVKSFCSPQYTTSKVGAFVLL